MANTRLTALQVERAHRANEPAMLADGGGLYFRKQSTSGASWTLRYRYAGREKWFALGNYPDMTLAEARTEARDARVQLDRGLDPMAEKRARVDAVRRRKLFRQLAEDWYDSEVIGQVKHPEIPRRHLDKYMLPALGSTPASEVAADDITRMLSKIRSRHPAAANDLLRYTKRVFDFGIRRHSIRHNPAASLTPRRDGGGIERARDRALSEGELRTLLDKIDKSASFGEPNSLAVKLLLCLCVRKNELLTATWGEFELDKPARRGGPVWHLPASRTKTGTSLDIPLVPPVVGWLRRMRALSEGTDFVFPRRRHDRKSRYAHVGVDTLNAALSQLEHGLEPFTVHDFRRTARTMLARQGTSLEVAERCLGHKLRGVVGTYDTHDYFNERRKALTKLGYAISRLADQSRRAPATSSGRKTHREAS